MMIFPLTRSGLHGLLWLVCWGLPLIAYAGEIEQQPAAAGLVAADLAYDRWYLDTVDGQPAGYTHEWMLAREDGLIESGYASHRVELHGGDRMVSDQRTVWLETPEGEPVSVMIESSAGTQTVRQTFTLLDDGVELVSEQGERTTTRRLPPVEGGWRFPAALELAWRERAAAGDAVIELVAWDPAVHRLPTTARYERGAAEQVQLPSGAWAEAVRWEVSDSALPGIQWHELYDAGHVMLCQRASLFGIVLVSSLTDASVAELEFDPPELAWLSTVRPDRPIRRPMRLRRAVFDLTPGGAAPEAPEAADPQDVPDHLLPPTTPHQRAERLGNGKLRLVIDLDTSNRLPQGDTPATCPAYLDASIMIDHRDEAVARLAGQVRERVGDEAGDQRFAEAARRFVTRYVQGINLSTGDATASEVARSRGGDCTECAVLLAAILRAQGIPSRCVTGLAYADTEFAGESDVFVYHMWTQAWIAAPSGNGGRWLDLDAAMGRYTAAHITLSTSAMEDANAGSEMIELFPMMNGLEIEVVEVGY